MGPGAYLTGYAGESDSLVVPLEVAGVPVVSANLSWNDSDRAGMTRLAAVSFERVEGKADAAETLVGQTARPEDLDLSGLDTPREDIEASLAVIPDEWAANIEDNAEYLTFLGPRVPNEVFDEFEALNTRIADAQKQA